MARKYIDPPKWRCFFTKKLVIEVLLSKEFFLCCMGLMLWLISSYPYQTGEKPSISYLQEVEGKLNITKNDTTPKIIKLSDNISLRPFLFQKIPVNIADSDLIQTISGIGEKTAHAIIEERKNGIFLSSNDLIRVHGIGQKTAKKLEHYLTFEIPKSVQQYDTN